MFRVSSTGIKKICFSTLERKCVIFRIKLRITKDGWFEIWGFTSYSGMRRRRAKNYFSKTSNQTSPSENRNVPSQTRQLSSNAQKLEKHPQSLWQDEHERLASFFWEVNLQRRSKPALFVICLTFSCFSRNFDPCRLIPLGAQYHQGRILGVPLDISGDEWKHALH